MFAKSAQGRILRDRSRYDLTDTPGARLQPLLPTQKPATGRPAAAHRRSCQGMLWLLRTGAPWRALPARYGPWRTVASRLYRWRQTGVWERRFAAVPPQADANGPLDGAVPSVDGTMVRAPQHAAGAKTGRRTRKRLAGAQEASVPQSTGGRPVAGSSGRSS